MGPGPLGRKGATMTSTARATARADHHDEDSAHLAALGYDYDQQFTRDMGFWGNIALGFTYLSPVVGVYTTLAPAMGIAGPGVVWWLLIAALGQLMVALIFGEVVSTYPVAGGVYPWSRRLWGPKWGWLNGWVYSLAICVTIASVAYGAGPFLGALLGVEMSQQANVLIALGTILLATLANFGGTKLLAQIAFWGFVAEIVATIAIGGWLLFAARKHDLSVLFTDFRPSEMQAEQSFIIPFALAAFMGIFLFYGFEACGDVAEEVKNPGRTIPRAMRMTIYIGGIASLFIAVGLVLALPDYTAVLDGTAEDPIGALFLEVFGPVGFRIVMAVVCVSFISCVISLQAAASRLLFSMGRDQALPGWKLLGTFNERFRVPPYALIVAALIPAIVIVGSLLSENALLAIISFASFGVYLGFQMVVVAALYARAKGWRGRGKFTLGAWGWIVNVLALAWGVFGMVILAWPAGDESTPWFDKWIVLVSALLVVGVGVIYLVAAKPHLRSNAPHGDHHTGQIPVQTADGGSLSSVSTSR